LIIVSDLLDNPQTPLSAVKIPDGVPVVMIAVAPDFKHGTTGAVVARVREWERVRNVTVLTTSELDPRLWGRVKPGR
jgi:hypothetical protein